MINSKIKIEPRVIQHLGQDLYTIDVNLKSIGEA